MTFHTTTPNILYDHVLGEIEAGREAAALLLLAGMLDAAQTDAARARHWHIDLLEHALYTFISKPGIQATAMAHLGSSRGLAARLELGRNAVEAAWKRGKQILLLQCGDAGETDGLQGHALDNIAVERSGIEHTETRHDLILASSLADQLSHAQLGNLIDRAKKRLKPGGALLLSCFVPGHLGGGLHRVCTGQAVHCHDETDLAKIAANAGCTISSFRDASNSLIWAELRVDLSVSHAQGGQK